VRKRKEAREADRASSRRFRWGKTTIEVPPALGRGCRQTRTASLEKLKIGENVNIVKDYL
jgi:predicted metallo-beta-lactamase superfamily hydrolase